MKRICIIGNSHTASLKLAYQALEKKTFQAVFWSIHGAFGPTTYVKNGKLAIEKKWLPKLKTDIMPHPGLELDLSGFDAVLLSGIGSGAIRKDRGLGLGEYVIPEFLSSYDTDKKVISKAIYLQIVRDVLTELESFKNIDNVASIFKGPIFIQLFPLPTPNIISQEDFPLPYGENLGAFISMWYREQKSIMEAHIANKAITLLSYPEEWYQCGFSPEKYRTKRDAWHLNAQFGEYFWANMMPNLN